MKIKNILDFDSLPLHLERVGVRLIFLCLMLTNCLTVDTANLAREGNVKLVEQNKTCGDVAKEVTIWKILYGTSDLGENDADTVLEGLEKRKPYAIQEKITGVDMAVTLLAGLASITRSTLLITSCETKKKKQCCPESDDCYRCSRPVYKKKRCYKPKRRRMYRRRFYR